MINPNGDEFRDAPQGGIQNGGNEDAVTENRWRQKAGRWSDAAGNAWEQTKDRAVAARQKTEYVLRENPVPTVIGALVLGLAVGLAIRYAYTSDEKEVEAKTPLGDVNLGWLSLPFLWPFFRSMQRKAGDVAEAAKDGVDRIRSVDVDDYVKPLRKKWKAWTN